MLDELLHRFQRLLQSDALEYVLAGLFIVIWIVASQVVGLLRGRRPPAAEPRPRRRLPLG